MPKKSTIGFFIVCIILISATVYPVDAYITKPGGAYPLEPLVNIEGGDEDDKGTMSLMTIALAKATPLTYAWAKVSEHQEILQTNQVRNPDEDEEEYNVRQLHLMSQSQFSAIQVAFEKAGKPYEIKTKGVFVLNVLPNGAADGLLSPGDRILQIDDIKSDAQQGIIDYLKQKKLGDKVILIVDRDGEKDSVEVELKPIPTDESRAGLGITFTDDKEITTTPKVNIKADDIGGPSAGLMFTLEILNQLMDEDLTKGYKVAGTGTMQENGEVGRIGGIDLKVIAADKEDIEIFFAPDDELPEEVLKNNPSLRSNYLDAKETAEKIGTTMKIVPVKTVDDALAYLNQLKPKK
ncbi:PDZ domain-containing protein [Paenisporosarcina quisquiliarum]|uniref:endopeptidase La n=1 Tax=Paenisporosarcina quisquiliarum TaxID=365346 RepID=A0A9X3LEH2_9BACL|nr:SepM family pheromone-processing serine protease [Paenisporosarcina quisquiliarum]MCZ8536413.1 PDZ domain-containing protein [Paenisporosarcina quisquiliarum]